MIADQLHAWSENDPNPEYFFGGDDATVLSMMQGTCADGARVIRGLLAEIAALREGHLEGDAVAGAEVATGLMRALDLIREHYSTWSPETGDAYEGEALRAVTAIRALPAKTGGRHGE